MDWLGLIPVIDRLPTSRYPGGRRNPSKIVPHYAISWESDEDTTDKGATERGPLIPTKWHMATSTLSLIATWVMTSIYTWYIHIQVWESGWRHRKDICNHCIRQQWHMLFPLSWLGKMALGKSQVGSFVQDSIREAADDLIYIVTPLYLNELLMSN